MIDLHSHTTASDGTYEPVELIHHAAAIGLEALSITDHDNFAGYYEARPVAEAIGLTLLCGIELSTKMLTPARRTVHLLGYFPEGPAPDFEQWLIAMHASRRDRNIRLAARLRDMGVDITIEEVEALGRRMAGRPHFARILIQKGYVASPSEAFERYLDESAPGYVERQEPLIEEGIRRINEAGGISVLAHPIRLGKRDPADEESLIGAMHALGLRGIEVYHSDHSSSDCARYLSIARRYELLITGGSDFHGANKPAVDLGTGIRGNLHVSRKILDALLAGAAQGSRGPVNR